MKYADDIAAVSGLGLVGWGAWQYSPPAAAIAVGAVLLVIGLMAATTKAIRK